jgi:GT2 family glycosyltransferase
MPELSLIIVNWNRRDELARNLEHLARLRRRGPDFEVIVVDNGSTDGSAEWLAERARDGDGLRLVRAGSNLGPARGRNLGIEVARGKYVVFLDSDALVSPRALGRLRDRMEADPRLGIAGCRILNGASRRLDQWVYAEPAATHERREFETYSFSAAGAIVRVEALRAAGPFWDDLFIYNEEVDLSIRVIRAGYKVIYTPEARVYHYASPRGRGGPGVYWYYQARNWIWIFYRYYPAGARNRNVALYVLIYLAKGLLNLRLRACLAGLAAGLRRTDIIERFGDKLTAAELQTLGSLNRRRALRASR